MSTPILYASQMREADRRAIESLGIPGIVLMENAAYGAASLVMEILDGHHEAPIAVICGKGNNGGDGLALTRHLLCGGIDVRCALLGAEDDLTPDASTNLRILKAFAPEAVVPFEALHSSMTRYRGIIDAMLGTGAAGELRGAYRDAVRWANGCDAIRIALDIPTGIDSDRGISAGEFFHADATITLGALKPGLLLNSGIDASGAIYTVGIGAPPSLYEHSGVELLDAERAGSSGVPIDRGRNKYDRGKVLVIAGSAGMTGAAVMAAEAALRCGSGLTILALPATAAVTMPQRLSPEIMTRQLRSTEEGGFSSDAFEETIEASGTYDAIAIGPGLGRAPESGEAVRAIVRHAKAPVVLDADGLFPYNGRSDELRERASDLVITPHHGEMAKLLGLESAIIANDPLGIAKETAERLRCIVVLKGAPTVVAFPDGRCFINGAGNPGMATGGTGDVLTGMIASCIGQGEEYLESTLKGVFLHSLAGDLAAENAGEHSLIATDIIAHIPAACITLYQQ